jgi:hypothetical protein
MLNYDALAVVVRVETEEHLQRAERARLRRMDKECDAQRGPGVGAIAQLGGRLQRLVRPYRRTSPAPVAEQR